jgi:hypothetical protein
MSRIKAGDLKELQGLITFRICENFLYRKGDSKRKKTLQQELGLIYHGDAPSNTASYAALAFEGQSPLHGLYETVKMSLGSEHHIPVSFMSDSSSNVVAGQSFTLQMLKQAMLSVCSAACPIAGLSLWNQAEEIHKNCKKAMAFAKEKLNADGSVPSGTNNVEDIWNHVLDKMHEYTSQDTADLDFVNIENDDEDDLDDDDVGDNEEGGNGVGGAPSAPGMPAKLISCM